MPLSEWSEKQFLALTAGIVGGVLLITAGVLAYVYTTYTDLVQQIEVTTTDVNKLEKEAKRIDEVRKVLEDESAQKQVLLARVPEEANIEEFIGQINEQSRNAHVTVKGVKMAPSIVRRSAAPKYEPIRVKVECSSGFHELGQFLNRLEERMERLVAISGFKITAFKDGLHPGSKSLNVQLEIETYKYNKPGQGAKAAAAPAARP